MSLESFHPASRDWFQQRFGEPSAAQAQAWPAIMAGRHTLIAAPTGSGKTLAAFYCAIDRLVRQGCEGRLATGVQVLYVSPLKALGNDIHRNLEEPLDGIAESLHRMGLPPVTLRTAVRTGDTPPAERQRMSRNPPHVLVTTPESLYLLLTSPGGRAMLATVTTLIVDEIHALLGDKRGAHLALSVERLARLTVRAGGQAPQRVGLSATQKPVSLVARYLVGNGGSAEAGAGEDDADVPPANCEIIDVGFNRERDLRIEVPSSPLSALMSAEVWDELYQRLVELVSAHDTTLVFVNTRRLAERLALALADRLGEDCVCSHHGSMSRERRCAAEGKLKAGRLKVLVATASMELGIDIGTVDLVVQFASPKRIATFLQRVGRSGHSIHGIPKGILFPLTRDDLVEAAALLHSIRRGELDRIVMPDQPLDILAQQVVAEVAADADGDGPGHGGHSIASLHALFANAYPYRNLSAAEFDAVITMLGEGYTTRWGRRGTHLHIDRVNGRVRARRGAKLVALTNGGAIPDMFDYQVVLDPEDVVVGSLNEDFALEALPGDVFALGTHAWQLLRVDGLKVRVRDAAGMSPTVPFWFGEGPGRSTELSQSVSRLRQIIAEASAADDGDHGAAAQRWVLDNIAMPPAAARQLVDYLRAGQDALGVMPTRETLVMERFFDEVGDMHVVLHSPFGSRLNRAWGLALRKRFCKTFNFELQAAANEDAIVISLGSVHSFALHDVFKYLRSASVREILVQALLDAPMFEVRWRWNATRALALQRNRGGKRVPPQFQRMDAEDFVAHVFPDQIACQENITGNREIPDHPLVRQTIHDCLKEAMDIDGLETLLAAVEDTLAQPRGAGKLRLVAKDLRQPSPFAQEIINARPYAFLDDAPFEERRTNAIRHRGWADPAEARDFSQLDAEAIARVRDEAWPQVRDCEELHDALMGLGYMTAAEFARHGCERWQEPLLADGRIMSLDGLPGRPWIAAERLGQFKALHPETLAALAPPAALPSVPEAPESALREILRGRLEGLGPVTAARLGREMGVSEGATRQALLALEAEGFAFQGQFSALASREPGRQHDREHCPKPGREHENAADSGTESRHRSEPPAVIGALPEGEQAEKAAGMRGIPEVHQEMHETEWCERRLLQRIHRYTIDAHRRLIKSVSLQTYMIFLFKHHRIDPVVAGHGESLGLSEPRPDGQTRLQEALSLLDGYTAPAASWEGDLLPARVADYDPAWLDALCIAGRATWGRFERPVGTQRKRGPIRNTPVTVALRRNLDLWHGGAAAYGSEGVPAPAGLPAAGQVMQPRRQAHGNEGVPAPAGGSTGNDTQVGSGLSSLADRIADDLARHGASFFDQLRQRTGLLPAQLEEGLAELVGRGMVHADSFTGLRALLAPVKSKSRRHRAGTRGILFGMADAGRWSLLRPLAPASADGAALPPLGGGRTARERVAPQWEEAELERLAHIYLHRWGVLFRSLVQRETLAPPWRELLPALRRMELRGTVRGGRFVAGVGGEQFAYGETVDALRHLNKKRERQPPEAQPEFVTLAATDPLNLINLILPNGKLPRLAGNRVLFRDGVPVAVLEAGAVRFIREVDETERWSLRQALVQRRFPARLPA